MSNFTYIPDQAILLVDAVPDYRQLVPSTTEFVRSHVRGVVKPAKATRKEILRWCESEQHSDCRLARCEGDDGVVCACACHAGEDSISNFYLWDNSWLVDVSHDSHRAWWHRGTLARTPYAVTYVRSHP